MQTAENKSLMIFKMSKNFFAISVFCLCLGLGFSNASANTPDHGSDSAAHIEHLAEEEHAEEGGFNAGEMIMHHIADAHEIHFFNTTSWHATIPLPVILYTENGLEMFSSSNLYHNPAHLETGHGFEYGNFIMVDEVVYLKNEEGGISYDEAGSILNKAPLDLSITKTVVGLFLSTFLVLLLLILVGRKYKKNGHKVAPTGIQSLFEPLILFVKDQIVVPSIGGEKKAERFLPFLLSVFFFIWIANLLGLMSFLGGYNVMGSISVTMVLAFFVFVITNVNGNKNYWKHIFWPDGVPFAIKLILVPIEIAQIAIKPLVLMIRLTANITAGHIIILAFTALIFIFGQTSAIAGYSVGVGSLIFMVFMFFIELLVAFLQAYVFTLLSALYFGSAIEDAHH
ncbi:MAG: F-type H+-transporting ATPase subunit a [Bacteroidia bacterium]|jgi:F-type H+-transporting ATPase subunit a